MKELRTEMAGISYDVTQSLDDEFQQDASFQPTITVGSEILPLAIRHAMELYWDGSTPTKRLDQRGGSAGFSRFVNARIEGKMSEVALVKLLYKYFDIVSEVDWRIFGDYETTDDGDLRRLKGRDGEWYPMATDADIKKTKPWNQWLAIREEIYDLIDDDAPVILTKHRIGDDLDVDPWANADSWTDVDGDARFQRRLSAFADNMFPLEVEFVGTAFKTEFTDYFEEGSKLYDPDNGRDLGDPLRCDNWGVHVSDLNATPPRWNLVVSQIVGESPVDWGPLNVVDSY